MKNVLLIGSELGKGGAERSVSLLSYYLEQLQYNVTLCIISRTEKKKYYKTCDNVIFLDPPELTGIIGKIKAWRYRIKKLRALKKELNIDVAISFLEGPDYVNILTKGTEKTVLSIRGSKIHDKVISGNKGVLRKKLLIPSLYKRADKLVCVTEALSKEMQDHFNIPQKKIDVIYNFYETAEIIKLSNEPLNTEETKIFERPVIITSGRLHIAKEQDKLIKILAQLNKTANARLLILGDGELKEQLVSLATSLGLKVCDWENTQQYKDADVFFMGYQSNAFKFYKHSKLFALTSSWEGFPNVLAEALICNIPVVSTDCYTGPREILNIPGLSNEPVSGTARTEVGSLLPLLNNPDANIIKNWAEEIRYWLQTPIPPPNSFSKLTDRFTLDVMLNKWRDIIEN